MKRLVTSPIILAPFLRRLPLVLGITGAFLSVSGVSQAQQDYGDKLKAYAESDVKLCFACHDSAAGGGNKGQKFFTDTLKAAGWQGAQNGGANGLTAALDKIKADDEDTDGDNADDLAELKAGTNPSDDSDTPGGGSSGSGGSGGSGGGNNNGSGGGNNNGSAGAAPAAGAAGGAPAGNGSQATSAGCSYGNLPASSSAGRLGLLAGFGAFAAAYARRRKRH